jgi:hypothetical protein
MLKKVDVAVYDYLKEAQGGEEKSGNIVYDLKAGGVGYSTTGGHIDDIKPKLDEYKAKIVSGEIKVPRPSSTCESRSRFARVRLGATEPHDSRGGPGGAVAFPRARPKLPGSPATRWRPQERVPSPPMQPRPHPLAVELAGITKRFPGVVANKDISFKVRRGTVHASVR